MGLTIGYILCPLYFLNCIILKQNPLSFSSQSALHFGCFPPGMSVVDGRSQIPAASAGIDDQSLKLAIAISLLRSKAIQKQQQPSIVSNPPSDSDALRWKRKVSLYASSFSTFLVSFIFVLRWRSLIVDQWKFLG